MVEDKVEKKIGFFRSEESMDDCEGSTDDGLEQGVHYSDNSNFSKNKNKSLVIFGSRNYGRASVCGSSGTMYCQAEKCEADLREAKQYHKKHKVCEYHAKAQAVLVAGIRQRFCQQCSRFHEVSEFDETKRSCRMRLAGHNKRRRKNSAERRAEGSSRRGKRRMKIGIQEDKTCEHLLVG